MAAFLLRRLAQSVAVLLAVSLVAFSLFRFAGDPVAAMTGQEVSPEHRAEIRAELGLDDSVPVQYARFLGRAVQGDFGLSWRLREPVASVILARLPASIELVLLATLLALVAGIPLGCFAAFSPTRVLPRLLMALTLAGVSIPTFVTGTALIWLFSVHLGWLPSSGRATGGLFWFWPSSFTSTAGWRSIAMPALTLAFFQIAVIARLTRSEMLAVMATDHIRFSRARGLPEWRVRWFHGLRQALVPILTVTALNVGGLIAYSIVTETVFQWPGTGFLFIQSVEYADFPVLAAYLCLVALIFLAMNLLADLAAMRADPRLRERWPA